MPTPDEVAKKLAKQRGNIAPGTRFDNPKKKTKKKTKKPADNRPSLKGKPDPVKPRLEKKGAAQARLDRLVAKEKAAAKARAKKRAAARKKARTTKSQARRPDLLDLLNGP